MTEDSFLGRWHLNVSTSQKLYVHNTHTEFFKQVDNKFRTSLNIKKRNILKNIRTVKLTILKYIQYNKYIETTSTFLIFNSTPN